KKVFWVTVPDYPAAAKAYERAADRYAEQKWGVEALYKSGESYTKQAKRAEYDQSVAGQAISTFTDFITLHPDDPRVTEAKKTIRTLRTEQARGSYETAQYYEKKKRWDGAKIYYNEVINKDPESTYAALALSRIDAINKYIGR